MAARPSLVPWTLVLLLLASTTHAATVSWLAPVTGDWTDESKWSGGAVPGPADDVVIDVPGTYSVRIIGGPNIFPTMNSLTLGAATGAQTLDAVTQTIAVAGASSIAEGGRLLLYNSTVGGSGSLVNRGLIDLSQAQVNVPLDHFGTVNAHRNDCYITSITSRPGSSLLVGSDDTSTEARLRIGGAFVNHGTIRFQSTRQISDGDLFFASGVNAPDGVIETANGYPVYYELQGIVDNQGQILVRSPLQYSVLSVPVVNHGTIQVLTPGSELAIRSIFQTPKAFSNLGTIDIVAGGSVSAMGGTFNYDPGLVTGAGQLRFANISVHAMTLGATSAPTTFEGAVTADAVSSAGTILVTGAGNRITSSLATAAGSALRILDNPTITPTELTVRNNWTNLGTVDIAAAGTAPYNRIWMLTGKLTNGAGGTIRADAGIGGPGVVQGRLDNAGTMIANGQLQVLGGPLQHLPGGDVRGTGTFAISGAGYVDQGGTSPGESIGALTIVGDDVRSATSALTIDIGGLVPGTEHDRLTVTGAFQCAGTMRIVLAGGYVPTEGDVFTILTAGAVSGVFDTIEGQFLPGGLAFQPVYETDRVDLRVVEVSTPVLLRAFDAEAGEGGILLRWQIEERASFTDLAVERADRVDGPWQARALAITTDGTYETATDDDVAAGRSYWYRLAARRSDGTRTTFGPIQVTGVGTLELALARVLPNPTAGAARFRFALPAAGAARLTVHDVRGRLVDTPVARAFDAGWHEVAWRSDAAPGVYLLVLEAGGKRLTQRFTVVR